MGDVQRGLGIAVCLVAIATLYLLFREERRAPDDVERLAREVASLRAELEASRRAGEGAARPGEPHRAPPVGERWAGEVAVEDAGVVARPVAAESAADDVRLHGLEARRARFEAAYGNEVPGDAWSRSAVVDVDGRVRAALGPSSRLESVECRATMCRVTTWHPDGVTYEAFTRDVTMSIGRSPWGGSIATAPMADADAQFTGGSVVTFFMREGRPRIAAAAPPR